MRVSAKRVDHPRHTVDPEASLYSWAVALVETGRERRIPYKKLFFTLSSHHRFRLHCVSFLYIMGPTFTLQEISSPMPKQSKPDVVSIQGSHFAELTGPVPSFNVSTGDGREMRAASDFWLALILVLAAAAFLDFAAIM